MKGIKFEKDDMEFVHRKRKSGTEIIFISANIFFFFQFSEKFNIYTSKTILL